MKGLLVNFQRDYLFGRDVFSFGLYGKHNKMYVYKKERCIFLGVLIPLIKELKTIFEWCKKNFVLWRKFYKGSLVDKIICTSN